MPRAILVLLLGVIGLASGLQPMLAAEAGAREIEAQALRLQDAVRLYKRIDDAYRRKGQRAADIEFKALSKAERLRVKWAMSQFKVKVSRKERNLKPPRRYKPEPPANLRRFGAQAEVTAAAMASGCTSEVEELYAAPTLGGKEDNGGEGGVVFFRFAQFVEWCWSSSGEITSVACSAWPFDTGWGWGFVAFIPKDTMCTTQAGGIGRSSVTLQSQAEFEPCVAVRGVICGSSAFPYIRTFPQAGGGWPDAVKGA